MLESPCPFLLDRNVCAAAVLCCVVWMQERDPNLKPAFEKKSMWGQLDSHIKQQGTEPEQQQQ